ncbi:MAG: ATPase, T2SS/T4P/T4SS family [Kiritimatiellae bacterium]|jgi:pilus assembly protein CpaF|nr:ATPase, T2SS/T4P/T4SS family [Kiritimatiellia bacterium]
MPKIKLIINTPGAHQNKFELEHGTYTIGRDASCMIRLNHPDVDARHAMLSIQEDNYWLEDFATKNGTYVNNTRINSGIHIEPNNKISIGPFTLALKVSTPVSQVEQSVSIESERIPVPEKKFDYVAPLPEAPKSTQPPPLPKQEDIKKPTISDEDLALEKAIKKQIHDELVERLDIKRLSTSKINKDELTKRAKETIGKIINDIKHKLPKDIDPEVLRQDIFNEALGLGPLEEFLIDPEITEIMVNGPTKIFVEKKGKLLLSGKTFMNEDSVLSIIERIVAPIGRRVDESQPYVDARLADGSRVNAVIPPLSLTGPCITIRKFSETPFSSDDLIRFNTWNQDMVDFMRICILLRKNIIVAGGTGSGKTTLLNVLSNYIPGTERILTIEDAAELKLDQEHLVRLEARSANIEGKGSITIRDLVRNALRMRPDRIIVGECRGGEALDMLQAMNTGHDGSLTTVHANSPRDALSRLETMVLMAGMDLPLKVIREQVSSAVDIIIQETRFSDGTRKIVNISEIVGQEGEQITMQDIFVYEQTGIDEEGRVLGEFKPTGSVPTFMEELKTRGLSLRIEMFKPNKHMDNY